MKVNCILCWGSPSGDQGICNTLSLQLFTGSLSPKVLVHFKLRMNHPETWKTALILFQELNTSWTLFLVPTDVSLWDVNPAAEQTPPKVSGLVSRLWDLLESRVLAGCPLRASMRQPQLQKSCHYVRNLSYIPCYHLAQEQEGLGHDRLVL